MHFRNLRPPPESAAGPATALPAFKRYVLHPTFILQLLGAYPLPGPDPAFIGQGEDATLVGPDQFQRTADELWRLRLRDGKTVSLLVECHSRSDRSMPYRILHAVATRARIRPPECRRTRSASALEAGRHNGKCKRSRRLLLCAVGYGTR